MRARLDLKFGPRWVPLALLLLLAVSFGPLIPWLGLYWDDWETILVAKLFPVSEFWSYFPPDRPLAGWTYVLFVPILGTRPLHWHLFALFLRWVTVWGMWWVFKTLWPGQRRQVAMAALLFAVYPAVLKQPISVAFHQHWLGFALYFGSIGLMLHAQTHQRNYKPVTLASLATMALHLAIFEYFVGVELLRPFLIWLTVNSSDKRERFTQTLKGWLPYLLLLVTFSAWRLWISLGDPAGSNPPHLLLDFVTQPLSSLARLLELAFDGSFRVLLSVWLTAMQSQFIYPQRRFVYLSWAIGAICALLIAIYLARIDKGVGRSNSSDRSWMRQAASIGLLATVLGPLPVWLTDRRVLTGLFSDRFALAAMFGASLLWVAALEWLRFRWRPIAIVLSVMIGASVALHLRVANDYRRSWIDQTRFYWQLFWRAPQISRQTALLSDGDVFGYTSPTFSTNLLYLEPRNSRELAYAFYSLDDESVGGVDGVLRGGDFNQTARQFEFSAAKLDSLAIHSPPSPKCLWVLESKDMDDPLVPSSLGRIAPISNLDRIGPIPGTGDYPPSEIFGPEPAHDWCYFFEKADLARQHQDWGRVAQLADEARSRGYSPATPESNSAHEWSPMIEGYARLGRWEDAEAITLATYEAEPAYWEVLCSLWGRSVQTEIPSDPGHRSYERMVVGLNCDR